MWKGGGVEGGEAQVKINGFGFHMVLVRMVQCDRTRISFGQYAKKPKGFDISSY